MATEIVVDSANWPVNIIRVRGSPEHVVERAEIEKFCAALMSFTARRSPYANIIDLTLCGSVSASERRFVASSLEQHNEEFRKYLIAGAIVLVSPVLRGVLTAVSWLRPPVAPTAFVASILEGEQFVAPLLAASGVEWAGLCASDRIATKWR